jgi:hypothetical protein
MTAVQSQQATDADRRSDTESLLVARRHRAALLQSIHSFEQALAAPAGDPAWRDRVVGRLRGLCSQFAEHIMVTEGPDGLYAEVLDHAPRLVRRVHVLVREHAAVEAALSALERRALLPETTTGQLRSWSADLLQELSRHRQRGADLVYEAYHTDIGGET